MKCLKCGKEHNNKKFCSNSCRTIYYNGLKDISGKNNPNYIDGRKCNNRCLDCGKRISQKSTRCSICSTIGKNNPNYQGGLKLNPYSSDFGKPLKRWIRERDNYTCQECGIKESELDRNLDIHHIDRDKQNSNPDNLISLCNKCHGTLHGSRKVRVCY